MENCIRIYTGCFLRFEIEIDPTTKKLFRVYWIPQQLLKKGLSNSDKSYGDIIPEVHPLDIWSELFQQFIHSGLKPSLASLQCWANLCRDLCSVKLYSCSMGSEVGLHELLWWLLWAWREKHPLSATPVVPKLKSQVFLN